MLDHTQTPAQAETRLIKISEVKRLTGLSIPTIYRFINLGSFPKSVSIGPRATAWILSEIENWIQSRIALRDKPNDE